MSKDTKKILVGLGAAFLVIYLYKKYHKQDDFILEGEITKEK